MMSGLYVLGGSSIVIENLADQLCKRGVEVTIGALLFKRFPPKGAYEVAAIPVGNILKLKRFLENFDIIHNHHPITNYLALVSRKPFMYHYHGAPDFGWGNLLRYSMLPSIKITNHYIDAVIAVSETAGAELKRLFSLDKVHVVYDCVDTTLFKPGLKEKFRKGSPQLLFVGNLYKHKNVGELIFALKELVKEYPEAYLQIVGHGRMYGYLKHLIAGLGLENNVELVGRVSSFELPYYYASCDVYITASRWELFGLPLLEAMACGKPVVASSIPSHVELITKAKAGITYTAGEIDVLCKNIIRAHEASDKYRSNALFFAKEHDWSVMADQTLRIYAEILHR